MEEENHMIAPANNHSTMPTQEEFADLVKRANAGDDDALAMMRRTLDANPEIWQRVGDLAVHAQQSLVNLIAGGNKLVSESLLRKAAEMRTELSGPKPSKMEMLAVERIVACWLEMEYLATTYPVAKGETLGQARFVLRQRESAERRFQAAMKSLTMLRALLPKCSESKPSPSAAEHGNADRCMSKRPGERPRGSDGERRTNGHTSNRLKAYFAEPEPAEV